MRALDEEFVEEVSDNLFRKHFTGSPNRFLSRAAVTAIEDIGTKLQAERIVEGRVITPKWYVQQLIGRRLILNVQELMSLLITELKESLPRSTSGPKKVRLCFSVRRFPLAEKHVRYSKRTWVPPRVGSQSSTCSKKFQMSLGLQ